MNTEPVAPDSRSRDDNVTDLIAARARRGAVGAGLATTASPAVAHSPLPADTSAEPSGQYRTFLPGLRRPRYRRRAGAHVKLLRGDAAQTPHGSLPRSTAGWRPIVLDVDHRADRQILANLGADPLIEVIDVLERQRAELQRLLPAPDPALFEERPAHVYFPWRRAVVRMLGPRAFSVVRLDRNRNRITFEEQARLRGQRVGIVGLSSGHAVATTLTLEGLCGELRLADFDDVELTNLNRLPASVLDVGQNKAVVAARRVAEIDPYLPVSIATRGVCSDNVEEFVAGLDVLVEQCDDLSVKLLVREVARRQRVAVVMVTSDRGLLDVERFDLEPERDVLHGLLGATTARDVETLSVIEKIPHVLAVVDAAHGSARAAASLVEIGRTLSTWPQLATETSLGGASIATAIRRLGIGDRLPSGRVRVDLDELLADLAPPTREPHLAGTGTSPAPSQPGSAPERALPAEPPSDPLLAVVHAAAMAPSGGNAQPWRFELEGASLSFILEPSSSLIDVRSRGSFVALGAALFNARVAAAHVDRLGSVRLFPQGTDSPLVATLSLRDGSDADLGRRYRSVLARCSNRRLGEPRPLDLSLTDALADAASSEGACLHLVCDRDQLAECGAILGEAQRVRFLTPRLHAEMTDEIRWPGDDVRTGIDVGTLELSPAETATLDLARRADVMALLESWGAGSALGDQARRAVLSSSALAVVTVPDSSPAAYVAGGMAAERVWVDAQAAGLAVQAIAPPFLFATEAADFDTLGGEKWAAELRSLAQRFCQVIDVGAARGLCLVLRLGYAQAPSMRSARLPLDAVLARRDLAAAD